MLKRPIFSRHAKHVLTEALTKEPSKRRILTESKRVRGRESEREREKEEEREKESARE